MYPQSMGHISKTNYLCWKFSCINIDIHKDDLCVAKYMLHNDYLSNMRRNKRTFSAEPVFSTCNITWLWCLTSKERFSKHP